MYWPKHATRNNTNVLAKAIPKLKEAKKKKLPFPFSRRSLEVM